MFLCSSPLQKLGCLEEFVRRQLSNRGTSDARWHCRVGKLTFSGTCSVSIVRGGTGTVCGERTTERWDGCPHSDIWRIPQFSSRVTTWVSQDRVTNGEVVRMAIHTSLNTPADQQMIIYTLTFTVEHRLRVSSEPPGNYRAQIRVAESGVVEADLRVRMIAPPITIANQSTTYHGNIPHRIGALPLAAPTKPTPVIAQRKRTSAIVATISRLFAAVATRQPTTSDRRMWPTRIPLLNQNKKAWACDQV